jgi:hypothetical protein
MSQARHALRRENWKRSLDNRPSRTVEVPTDEIEEGSFFTIGQLRRKQIHALNERCNRSDEKGVVDIDSAEFEAQLVIECSLGELLPEDAVWLKEEYSDVFERLSRAAMEINGLNRTDKEAGKSTPA